MFHQSVFRKLYNTVIAVLRAFFRIFDDVALTLTLRKELMRDTETPFARRMTGKMHCFTDVEHPL